MNRIEPTGSQRLEWYLARLIAATKNVWGGQVDWRDELIGYEEPDQTPEEMLNILEGL